MSYLGDIMRPIFDLLAGMITFFYSIVPNYAVAIALLTLAVMIVLSPLTIKSTKSMLQMQALQPRIKELQRQYKGDRQGLAEAQQALFKQSKVSPAGGCLPMLLQFPLLFVMYDVIRGLANTVKLKSGLVVASPKYITHSSLLYKHLMEAHGAMQSFGLNLSLTALGQHNGFFPAIPYYLLVILSVGLQYIQVQQIISKNPSAAAANPSATKLQQGTTLIFGFIYLEMPAGVVVYFLVSGIIRITQQELMWRHDPVLRAHSIEARRKVSDSKDSESTVLDVQDISDVPGRFPRKGGLRGLISGAASQEDRTEESTPPKPRPQNNRSNKRRKRR
ncbi:MAG: YidC/Oxa1 family membrane protein insertase [Ferrimicrobium sp.]